MDPSRRVSPSNLFSFPVASVALTRLVSPLKIKTVSRPGFLLQNRRGRLDSPLQPKVTFEIPGRGDASPPSSASCFLSESQFNFGFGAGPDSRRSQRVAAPLTALTVASGASCYKTGRASAPSVWRLTRRRFFISLSRLRLKAFLHRPKLSFYFRIYFHERVGASKVTSLHLAGRKQFRKEGRNGRNKRC